MNFCHNETIAYKRWRFHKSLCIKQSSHYGKNSYNYRFENNRKISHINLGFFKKISKKKLLLLILM